MWPRGVANVDFTGRLTSQPAEREQCRSLCSELAHREPRRDAFDGKMACTKDEL